jgi:di/tricarboxylate transporter
MLGIVVAVFIGLARNTAPPDVLLLAGTILAGLLGIIKPEEVFAGFGNPSMLMVGALFVVAASLRETGALDIIGGRMMGRARTERGALLRMAGVLTVASAFLNNTPIVAMFLPIIVDWCRKHQISPSRLLMPLSFLTIMGGMCTMIGTSTNLVVNGLMSDYVKLPGVSPQTQEALRPMWLFELGMAGLPLAIVGTAFIYFFGRRLLPDNRKLIEQLGERAREYLVDVVVQPSCRLVGQTVEAAGLRHLPGLFLIEINRPERTITPVEPDEILRAGDRLTFTGVVNTIVDLERVPGLVPAADDGYESSEGAARRSRRLTEAVVSNTSPLIGKSIRGADFRALYNAAVVAVHRGGTRLHGRIGDIVMRAGDTLLLQTGPHFARAHCNNPDFFLVSSVEESRPIRHERAPIALVLLGVLIGLLALGRPFGISETLSAFLIGGLMLASRCISMTDARQSVDWQTLVAIGASFGLGKAIEVSGLADILGQLIGASAAFGGEQFGPIVALSAVYLITMVSSELLTNNASAALLFPFAVSVAEVCGADPRPFAMAVAFAASAAFATPIGYQTHMMVWSPGGYRFQDFVKLGVPLDIIIWIGATILIPIMWPL